MQIDTSDYARSFRVPETIDLRRLMLHEPHIASLTLFVEKLRIAHPTWEFPDFDPLDGGSKSDILLLLEKPGPMTSVRGKGSGFISRNNDDPTAEAIFGFLKEAGISRKRTIIWNIIPGWNGTRKVTTKELIEGVDCLKSLIPLLPNLKTIILVGRKAQRAKHYVNLLGFRVLVSPHPSPIVKATQLNEWCAIPSIWAQANV